VPPHARIAAEYHYATAEGRTAVKVRWEWTAEGEPKPAKTLRWYHVDDDGRHYWGVPPGWRLRLYSEARIRKVAQAGGTVYLCEGEKCADALDVALATAGIADAVATTLGNEKDLLPGHLAAMEGASRVVVLADSDAKGRTQGQRHARQLREQYVDVRLRDLYPDRDDAEKGFDVADWLAAGGTVEELRDLIDRTPIVEPSAVSVIDPEDGDGEADATEWPNEKEAPWPTMDPEAFYGLAGDLIRDIAEQTEADRIALLLTLLVAFGSAAGPSSYIIADSARHPAQLYAVLVGGTGTGRKGTSMKVMTRFLECADEEWFRAVHRSGFLSGEAIIADLAGDLDKVPSPYPGQALVVEPELARLLAVNNRDGSTTSHIIRDGWDGGTLSAIRRAERTRVEGAYLCILGHISPEELAEKLTSDQIYNGFANRCLFVYVRRSKKLSSGGHIDQALIGHYSGRLRAAMDFARTGREMKRTPAAEVLWDKLYNEEPDSDGILGAFTARGPAQMLRLSVAYTLLDMSPVIDVPHLQAAAAVWRYCRASVSRRIDIDLSTDERKLLEALRDKHPKAMTAREIHQLFSGKRSAKERGQIVERLVERGLATVTKAPTSGAFRKPASLVRALSIVDGAHSAHSAHSVTTRVSQHSTGAHTAHLLEVDANPVA
jgi:hypothetical protein